MNSDKYKNAMDKVSPSDELKDKTFRLATKQNTKTSRLNTALKLASALCVFVFTFGIVAVSTKMNPFGNNPQNNESPAPVKIAGLSTVDSYDNLKTILEKVESNPNARYKGADLVFEDATINTAPSTMESATNGKTSNTESTESGSYSKTNTQVENVDEADIVKTDGKYVYYIHYSNKGTYNNKLTIVDCKTDEVVKTIDFEKITPQEMFVYNDKLIVIGYKYYNYRNEFIDEDVYYTGVYYGNNSTIAMIYDISDIKNPKEERVLELEGSYIGSRMINQYFYLITSKYINEIDENVIRPYYIDSAIGDEKCYKDYCDIYYMENFEEESFLSIACIDVTDNKKLNIETFLGAGEDIYCSENNIYVYFEKFDYSNWRDVKTAIYKFEVNGISIDLKAQTEINGEINDQFSFDEYEGNLRVAATEYKEVFSFGSLIEYGEVFDYDTSNTLYVLDENLNEIGKIENMAVGEDIYSVRFIGNKGYIVTFEQIDPLFVIDLSDPRNPKVAGELKIPGYSSYLHPYDENHIIGIGFDTKENKWGGISNDNIKMSMFDVTDPSNPVEMFTIALDKNTYSEATNNHKAIMVSKEKNIIAFPVSGGSKYYTSKAVVFNIDLEKGFTKAGEITNGSEKDSYSYRYSNSIERIIFAAEKFYTLSNANIGVTNMNTFEKIKDIEL